MPSAPIHSIDCPVNVVDNTDLGNVIPQGLEGVQIYNLATGTYWQYLPRAVSLGPGQIAAKGGGAWQQLGSGSSTGITITQLKWAIDPVNGLDSNTGAPGSPLKTGAELYRRTAGGFWSQGVYEIFVLGNLPSPDFLWLDGVRTTSSTVIPHGSATAGQAPTANALYTSVAGMTARVTQNRTGNTRGTITDAAIPTGSWSGAGLISNAATPNKRIRLTDGANAGSIAWPQRSEAAQAVDVSQWLAVPPLTGALTVSSPAEIAVAGNEHFVVEQLVKIDLVMVTLQTLDNGTTNTSGIGVLFDSLDVPNISSRYACPIMFWGCAEVDMLASAANANLLGGANYLALACQVGGQGVRSVEAGQYFKLIGCHLTRSLNIHHGGAVNIDGDTICEGESLCTVQQGGVCCIGSAASFNSVSEGLAVRAPGSLSFANGIGSYGFLLWGSGAAGTGFRVESGCSVTVPPTANTPIITGASDFTLAGDTQGIGRSAAGVATGLINFTWANLVAAQAAGFGGSARNENKSCSVSNANI